MSYIDSRLPVDTGVAPIKISLEDDYQLSKIMDSSRELDQVRMEIGRLTQVLSNLVKMACSAEDALKLDRKVLSDKYSIPDGSWALDFETKCFVKLERKVPTVV